MRHRSWLKCIQSRALQRLAILHLRTHVNRRKQAGSRTNSPWQSGGERPGHCLLKLKGPTSLSRPNATVRHRLCSLAIDLDIKTRKSGKKTRGRNQPRFLHQALQQLRKNCANAVTSERSEGLQSIQGTLCRCIRIRIFHFNSGVVARSSVAVFVDRCCVCLETRGKHERARSGLHLCFWADYVRVFKSSSGMQDNIQARCLFLRPG